MRKALWILVALIATCIGGLAGLWTAEFGKAHPLPSAASSAGATRRDFALTDMSGQRVSLAAYRGKWLLIYFGFTSCPEACPLALSNIAATLKAMPPSASTVQPLFITIDPERDTPTLLKEYLANFSGNFVGLTGTAAEIAAVAKAYGVYYAKRPTDHGDYTMDHSTALYLVDRDGILVRLFDATVDAAGLAHELEGAMTEQKQAAAP